MSELNYSVVAYLSGELRDFVDGFRKRLNPNFAGWLAHVSILPPRPLQAAQKEAVQAIQSRCAQWEPFQVGIDGVATFWPVKGVVYLSLSFGSQLLVELHDALNCGGLECVEPYPYVPHVTIAQELDEAGMHAVLEDVSCQWSRFVGERAFHLESLSLVQQTPENGWNDLATLPLGSLLTPSRK